MEEHISRQLIKADIVISIQKQKPFPVTSENVLIPDSSENQGIEKLARLIDVHEKVVQPRDLAVSLRSEICGVARDIKEW